MARLWLIPVILTLLAAASCSDSTGPAPDSRSANIADADDVTVPVVVASPAAWLTAGRLLFLHRSVGFALINDAEVDMYDVLAELNAEHGTATGMWHHGCGSDPYWDRYYDGSDDLVVPNFGPAMSEYLYANPEQWKKIFCDPDAQYVAARDSIDNFRVIVFKSGYDNTVHRATESTGEWREYYRTMKECELFNDTTKRIVVLGFPPLREGFGTATQADADSSRAFNEWLVEDFVRDRDNLYGFPFFDRLAGADNWLRDEYEKVDNPNDSHPNPEGCEIVGRELMTFMHSVALGEEEPPPPPPNRVRVFAERHSPAGDTR